MHRIGKKRRHRIGKIWKNTARWDRVDRIGTISRIDRIGK